MYQNPRLRAMFAPEESPIRDTDWFDLDASSRTDRRYFCTVGRDVLAGLLGARGGDTNVKV